MGSQRLLVQYTKEDICDMKVIHSSDGNGYQTSVIHSQRSFDDFCCGPASGDYDNLNYVSYSRKPVSTSITNLFAAAPMGIHGNDPESFFSTKSHRTTGNNVGSHDFDRGSQTSVDRSHYGSNHEINPHFKIKHDCVRDLPLKHNLSSPILSNVKHGRIPKSPLSFGPAILKDPYDRQVARSSTELNRIDPFLSAGANGSPPLSLKSSLSLRSNSPNLAPLSRFSRYDNVGEEEIASRSSGGKKEAGDANKDPFGSASLKILSRKMFRLEGFSKEDIAKKINKPTEYSQRLGREYLLCFNFERQTVVQSLREFLRKITICGETQERERVLDFFSGRYFQCNPQCFKSADSCHTITCAIILLNTDFYGQNIGKKMTQQSFLQNLKGLNGGGDFDTSTLKSIYQSISKEPLPIEVYRSSSSSSQSLPSPTRNAPQKRPGDNPFLDVSDPRKGMVFKRGYMMRKACIDSDGTKIPLGKRGWKMFYATLCDTTLFLHKDPAGFEGETSVVDLNCDSLKVHHSLASLPQNYRKKQFVFELRLANWAVFLFQSSSEVECQQWVDAVNLAAACFSAPALPSGVGSQMTFRRPLLPISPTKLDLLEQLQEHERNSKKFEREFVEHASARPDRNARTRDVQDFLEKEKYLSFEQLRYRAYMTVLRRNIDKLKSKGRFRIVDALQRAKLGDLDAKSRSLCSSMYSIRSTPAIIFETRV